MGALKKTAAVLGVGAGLYLGATGGHLDWSDAKAERRSDEELLRLVHERTIEKYRRADNIGRFTLQYLQDPRDREEVRVGTMENGDSLVGAVHRTLWGRMLTPEIGSCILHGSVYYDPLHPITEEVEGSLDKPSPTFGSEGDMFIVYPADSDQVPLRFEVDVNGVLNPADDPTEAVLEGSGCGEA